MDGESPKKVKLQDPEVLTEISDRISDLLAQSDSFQVGGNEPTKGSIAHNERTICSHPKYVLAAHNRSEIALHSAEDHLKTLLQALCDEEITMSPWSLARLTIEAAATSIWLGRPDIDVYERVRRGLSFQLQGFREQKKMANSPIWPSDFDAERMRVKVERQARRTYQIARVMGYAVNEIDPNKSVATDGYIENPFPGAVALCREELDMEMSYRYYSGPVHAHAFSLNALSYQEVGQPHRTPFGEIRTVERILSPEGRLAILCDVGKAYLKTICARWTLFGYKTEYVVPRLSALAESMRIDVIEWPILFWD